MRQFYRRGRFAVLFGVAAIGWNGVYLAKVGSDGALAHGRRVLMFLRETAGGESR
jgi:hypothetical protein